MAQFSSPKLLTISHYMRFLLALVYSFQKRNWQVIPSPTLSVQYNKEQWMDAPNRVQSFSYGCFSPFSSQNFWARVSMSPTAKRYRYFLSRKDDSEILTSACLNCLCQYSKRMMSAMQMTERRKSVTEGKACSSRKELKKSETFMDAMRTALTDTSFIRGLYYPRGK